MKSKTLLLIFTIVILGSCSIEKRLHTSGYHLDWKKTGKSHLNSEKNEVNERKINRLTPKTIVYKDENYYSNLAIDSKPKKIVHKTPRTGKSINLSKQKVTKTLNNECDLIIFKNGDEVEAKVLEIGINEVKYKKCNNLDGPTFTENKSKVFMIKHANGTKTLFEDDSEEKKSYSKTEDEYLQTVNSDDKSFIVAVALWFFLGILGIHRFYLGHIGIGVLYLLTGSLCGIGWIIDGILFLVGGLKPKRGKYIDL